MSKYISSLSSKIFQTVSDASSFSESGFFLLVYEALLLRELGYGGERPTIAGLGQALEILDRQEPLIARYLLADTRADVLAARELLRQRLARMIS